MLKLKEVLKRSYTQTKVKLQAAISRIQMKLERDDSQALRKVAACRAVGGSLLSIAEQDLFSCWF